MSNVVRLRQVPISDNVFFNKEDIKLGTILSNYGRREKGSKWRVKKIYTFYITEYQTLRSKKVEVCQKILDEIELERIGVKPKEARLGRKLNLTFSYLSYSAIWRLDHE